MAGFFNIDPSGNPVLTEADILQKRKLAQEMMKEGSQFSPVGHWTAALARALQGAAGGYEDAKLDAASKDNEKWASGLLTGALGGSTPSPAPQASMDAAAKPTGAVPSDTFGLIQKFEGFRGTPYWDVNAHRVGFGSDTVTLPDGTVQKVTPGTSVTKEDALRDLNRRVATEFVPRAASAVGPDNWQKLPQNVQAALTSVTYNYGKLPDSVAAAARSGDPNAIAAAVEGLKGHNGGINAWRRQQEAALIRGGGQPQAPSLGFQNPQTAMAMPPQGTQMAQAPTPPVGYAPQQESLASRPGMPPMISGPGAGDATPQPMQSPVPLPPRRPSDLAQAVTAPAPQPPVQMAQASPAAPSMPPVQQTPNNRAALIQLLSSGRTPANVRGVAQILLQNSLNKDDPLTVQQKQLAIQKMQREAANAAQTDPLDIRQKQLGIQKTERELQGDGATPLSEQERKDYGIPAEQPAYKTRTGEIKFGPAAPKITTTIDQKGETKFQEKTQTALAERFNDMAKEGDEAYQNQGMLDEIRRLGGKIDTGASAVIKQRLGALGLKTEGVAQIEAFNSLIDKLTPQQRVPGSGATSDFDAKLMKSSLPGLMNTPEGNQIILDTLDRLNQNKMMRGDIGLRVQMGDLTPKQGLDELRKLQTEARALSDRVKDEAAKSKSNNTGKTSTGVQWSIQ